MVGTMGWHGMDIGNVTWEEELVLKSQFLDHCHEDKVMIGGLAH